MNFNLPIGERDAKTLPIFHRVCMVHVPLAPVITGVYELDPWLRNMKVHYTHESWMDVEDIPDSPLPLMYIV